MELAALAVGFQILSRQRTRPYQAHVAVQYVEELRQLVNAVFAHEAADGRDSRVVADLEQMAGLFLLVRPAAGIHPCRVARPELVKSEVAAAAAHPLRLVEHRAFGGDLDDQRE